MIDVYATGSPNVRKVLIALEEMSLPYSVKVIDLAASANFAPDFVALSPAAKVPVIVDHGTEDGRPHAVFESGAILLYLAQKTGRFIPPDPIGRSVVTQWLMLQMANVGPGFGQLFYFNRYEPNNHSALDRFRTIVRNLVDVVERRLTESDFVGGASYTVADMAFMPWLQLVDAFLGEGAIAASPALAGWLDRLTARPAVIKALAVADDVRRQVPPLTDDMPKDIMDRLFGRGAYSRQ